MPTPETALSALLAAILEHPVLVDDPRWDTCAVMSSVTASAADVTAFSYAGAEPGRPAPLRGLRIQLFRDLHSALDGTWQVCIIRVERDSRRGAAEFIPPAEAAGWSITPASMRRVVERLRPQPSHFA